MSQFSLATCLAEEDPVQYFLNRTTEGHQALPDVKIALRQASTEDQERLAKVLAKADTTNHQMLLEQMVFVKPATPEAMADGKQPELGDDDQTLLKATNVIDTYLHGRGLWLGLMTAANPLNNLQQLTKSHQNMLYMASELNEGEVTAIADKFAQQGAFALKEATELLKTHCPNSTLCTAVHAKPFNLASIQDDMHEFYNTTTGWASKHAGAAKQSVTDGVHFAGDKGSELFTWMQQKGQDTASSATSMARNLCSLSFLKSPKPAEGKDEEEKEEVRGNQPIRIASGPGGQ